MRIAIIQPRTSYYLGGSEKVSIKHAQYLSELGHEIDFYTSTSLFIEDSELFKDFLRNKNKNINILKFDISDWFPGLYNLEPDTEHIRWVTESLAFNRKIFSCLEKRKADIILSYYLPDSILKPEGIPNVVYLAGYPLKSVTFYKSFIRFCDAAISISSNVKIKWKDELKNVKYDYILGTGVDYPILIKNKIKSNSKFNIVFAGRLYERKGIVTLVDAFKKISDIRTDVHLWILGKGEMEDLLIKKIRDFGLKNRITMTGLVNNPYDYFEIADICIFPSHHGDGLMGTVLEAMSCGKPVITTTKNGNEDVIINGENGILIEPKDENSIIKAIEDLLDNDLKRIKLGEKAKDFISKNIAWQKNIKKLSDILEDVVNKCN